MAKTARPVKTTKAAPAAKAETPKVARPRASRRKVSEPVEVLPASNGSNGSHEITASDIATRAFELYCARGGEHGHELEDWLRAEQEIAASYHSSLKG